MSLHFDRFLLLTKVGPILFNKKGLVVQYKSFTQLVIGAEHKWLSSVWGMSHSLYVKQLAAAHNVIWSIWQIKFTDLVYHLYKNV